jgi:hypothetical protein
LLVSLSDKANLELEQARAALNEAHERARQMRFLVEVFDEKHRDVDLVPTAGTQ